MVEGAKAARSGVIVVTGASTGIGEATARLLAERGCTVVAGVRNSEDGERLRREHSPDIQPVRLDVTDDDQIAAAVEAVERLAGGRGVRGLVNNAGVAHGGPLEFLPLEEWRNQLEVNVIGQVAVTKAFLPLIRAGSGRIAFIGSIGGRSASPMMGPYAASKFAIEAVGESLRQELYPWGIGVSVIEPGAVKTAIWNKGRATTNRLERDLGPAAQELYADRIALIRKVIDLQDRNGVDPIEVAEAVESALFSPRPRTRYVVGRDAKVEAILARFLPDRARDWIIRAGARALSRR